MGNSRVNARAPMGRKIRSLSTPSVVLAGSSGKSLEEQLGTAAAAALIYQASDPSLEKIPSWAASNEDAWTDIRRLAMINETGERTPN